MTAKNIPEATAAHALRPRTDFPRSTQWPELAYEYAVREGFEIYTDERGLWAKQGMTYVPLRAPMTEGESASTLPEFDVPKVEAKSVNEMPKVEPADWPAPEEKPKEDPVLDDSGKLDEFRHAREAEIEKKHSGKKK